MREPSEAKPWSEIVLYRPRPDRPSLLGESGELLDVSRLAISRTARGDYARFYPFSLPEIIPSDDPGDRGRRFLIFDALARSVQLHPFEAESLTARPVTSRSWYLLHPERTGIFVVLPREFVAAPIRERNPLLSGLVVTFVAFGLAQFREATVRLGPGSPPGPAVPWRAEALGDLHGLVEALQGVERATVARLRYEAAVGRLLAVLELQGVAAAPALAAAQGREVAAVRAARDEWERELGQGIAPG